MLFNKTFATKVVVGLVGIGSLSGGIYATNEYLFKTEISELLKKDDLVLLTKKDVNEKWAKRWREYFEKGNIWNLKSFQTNLSLKDNAPDDFKNTCISKATTKVKNNENKNYKEIASLCTKDFAISELIKKDNTIELISGKSAISGSNKWKKSWEKYFDNAKSTNPLGLDLSSSTKEVVHTQYEAKCLAKEKEEVKNNRDKNYSIVKDWCTERKFK